MQSIKLNNNTLWSMESLGEVLYSGSTNNTLTLTKSVLNFKYVEIFYTDEVGRQTNSMRIEPKNGNTSSGDGLVCLGLIETESDFVVLKNATWMFNGNQFEKQKEEFTQIFHNGTIVGNNNTGWLWIKKIVGYN